MTISRAPGSATPPTCSGRRPDTPPAACRDDQLEVAPAYLISEIFGAG